MAEYGVSPFDMHRLSLRDVDAIQRHHLGDAEADAEAENARAAHEDMMARHREKLERMGIASGR